MKTNKMDRKLVADNQPYEVDYLIKKYRGKLKREQVLDVIKALGRSRKKVDEALNNLIVPE